jgi:hypothetical protein
VEVTVRCGKSSEDSYLTCTPATAGQALRLPEPFGIALDTRRLLG